MAKIHIWQPAQGPLRVEVNPAKGSRALLLGVLPPRVRVDRHATLFGWVVSRRHVGPMARALGDLGHEVTVTTAIEPTTTCTDSCSSANPETVFECVCACLGREHGTRWAGAERVVYGPGYARVTSERTTVTRRFGPRAS